MNDLPEVLRRVAEEIDIPTARTLARELGGTTVYVAAAPRPGSQLARAVGLDAARRIARIFGHGHLAIPLGPTAAFVAREAVPTIRRLIAEGRNDNEIARAIHCHAKTVRRIRRGQRHRHLNHADW